MSQQAQLSGGMPPGILAAFAFEILPDGALRVVRRPKPHRRPLGGSIVGTIISGALAVVIAITARDFIAAGALRALNLLVILQILFGLLMAAWCALGISDILWRLFGSEEWHIHQNRFEWYGKMLGIRWRRSYQESKLWLRCNVNTPDKEEAPRGEPPPKLFGEPYLVLAKPDSKLWFQRLLLTSPNPDELLALGELLSRRLGWPLQQDPEFVECFNRSLSLREPV